MNPLLGTHLAFKRNVVKGLSDLGLKASQPKILYHIYSHEGCSQKDVSENCFIDTATLSTVLANLEQKQLITRVPDEDDKRAYKIYATEEGRKVMEAVDIQVEKSQQIALNGFSSEEIAQFTAYLERAFKNLNESNLE